jgi:hypothetical protein
MMAPGITPHRLLASYLAARRERKLKKYEAIPEVRATINKDTYPGGWRSAQLHVVPRKQHQQFQFNYHDWCIERVRLLRPWRAVLARAENDDYATAVFYPENPVRTLQGKAEGRPQRLELARDF